MVPRGLADIWALKDRCAQSGIAQDRLGCAGRRGRRAGKRPQGMAKRLIFTEGRLSFAAGTTRIENQAFRQPRGGPMEAALILRFLPIKRKEQKKVGSER